MMKKVQKLIYVFLVLIMVNNCASLFYGIKTSGNFKYKIISENKIAIVDYTGKDENVIIPNQINGLIVFEIEDLSNSLFRDAGKYDNNTMRTITIPESVGKVGSNAFSGCKKLTKIILLDSNENSLSKLSIFEGGTFNYIRPQIEYIPERKLTETLFENNNKKIIVQSNVNLRDITQTGGRMSFISNLLYNGKIIFGPITHEKNIKEYVDIKKNENNDVFIFIREKTTYSSLGHYDMVFFNGTNLISNSLLKDIQEINGNIFFIEEKSGFTYLYKNNVKLLDGIPHLRNIIIDDLGNNIAYITQNNNNIYTIYLNKIEYFSTNPSIQSTIIRIKFSKNGKNLYFVESFNTKEGYLFYINLNKKSFGPYRYLENEMFSEDSKYFSYKYNNNQGWIEERIEL